MILVMRSVLMNNLAKLALVLATLAGAASLGCSGGDTESAIDRVRASGYRGITMDVPTPKVDFTLDDTEGRPFSFMAETEGYTTLLFFGYTYCPDICPVHLANLSAVLKDLPWEVQNRIKVVFVTTDPERDTPARIREWLDAFDPSFIGLTGSREEVNRIQASFGLPPAQVQAGDSIDYIIGHASQILAFSTDNVARLAYPFGTRQADWSHDLPRLVREGPVIRFETAVIAAPLAGNDITALYLGLANDGTADDELLGVSTPIATTVEIHDQVDHGGTTTMEEIASLELPRGGRISMHPGGHHIMLIGLERAIRPGETVPLELEFRKSGTIRHFATVHSYADLESALEEESPASEMGGL